MDRSAECPRFLVRITLSDIQRSYASMLVSSFSECLLSMRRENILSAHRDRLFCDFLRRSVVEGNFLRQDRGFQFVHLIFSERFSPERLAKAISKLLKLKFKSYRPTRFSGVQLNNVSPFPREN